MISSVLKSKYLRLQEVIRGHESMLVALSGGIDSALLSVVAHQVLGDSMLAVTSFSPSVPEWDKKDALDIVAANKIPHRVINSFEIGNKNYAKNPQNRCYYCKSMLYENLDLLARKEGFNAIANGTNKDDLSDYRPGLVAGKEFNVVTPFVEVEINKSDIRELAKCLGVKTFSKPASPCLSSRIPYGMKVTSKKLRQIEEMEQFFIDLGASKVRARHFDKKVIIELPKEDQSLFGLSYDRFNDLAKGLGFEEVRMRTFKSGSLNKEIKT